MNCKRSKSLGPTNQTFVLGGVSLRDI